MALKSKAKQAKTMAPKNVLAAKSILDSFIIQLDSNRKKTVLEEAYQIIKPEVVFLKNSL